MKAQKFPDAGAALADVPDGATVLIGGFGNSGLPTQLIEGLINVGAKGLTVVSNNAGNGESGIAALLRNGQVNKMICSFPRQADSWVFDGLYRQGKVELELVPQGTLAERIRAGGAGLGPFFCPTSVGTDLQKGKEVRVFEGREYVLEHPIRADFSLIRAHTADDLGNLTYRKTARNFNPLMATASIVTIAQVDFIVSRGTIDPESVITPSIYVDRIVLTAVGEFHD